MKKLIAALVALVMLFSFGTAFAAELSDIQMVHIANIDAKYFGNEAMKHLDEDCGGCAVVTKEIEVGYYTLEWKHIYGNFYLPEYSYVTKTYNVEFLCCVLHTENVKADVLAKRYVSDEDDIDVWVGSLREGFEEVSLQQLVQEEIEELLKEAKEDWKLEFDAMEDIIHASRTDKEIWFDDLQAPRGSAVISTAAPAAPAPSIPQTGAVSVIGYALVALAGAALAISKKK